MTNTNTPIEWSDTTWNPISGCTYVSEGCTFCYAATLHNKRYIAWKRGNWDDAPAQYHLPFKRVQLLPERLDAPLHWRKPRRVFVNSVSDLFHEDVPDDYIERVFAIMAVTPQHTYQVLTKRPERMQQWVSAVGEMQWGARERMASFVRSQVDRARERLRLERLLTYLWKWPLPNVWLGTSVEDQRAADERIPLLLETPAAVRFLSCEPLLDAVDLRPWLQQGWLCEFCYRRDTSRNLPDGWAWEWQSAICPDCYPRFQQDGGAASVRGGAYTTTHDPRPWRSGLSWVIAGGESGAHARPMDLDWARSLRDQCVAANVPYFFKQVGGRTPKANGRLLDGREWNEYPKSLHTHTSEGV